jgi:PTS system nitrogen regulatory IIA component
VQERDNLRPASRKLILLSRSYIDTYGTGTDLMKITDFLTPEMIAPSLKGQTKPEVLQELAGCLTREHPEIPLAEMSTVLAERERLGSTAIGDGIAIPHGKLPKVTKILGTFGRHVQGVDFESLDGNPTHLFFMLVAPEDSTSARAGLAFAARWKLPREASCRARFQRNLPPHPRGRQQVLVRLARA